MSSNKAVKLDNDKFKVLNYGCIDFNYLYTYPCLTNAICIKEDIEIQFNITNNEQVRYITRDFKTFVRIKPKSPIIIDNFYRDDYEYAYPVSTFLCQGDLEEIIFKKLKSFARENFDLKGYRLRNNGVAMFSETKEYFTKSKKLAVLEYRHPTALVGGYKYVLFLIESDLGGR